MLIMLSIGVLINTQRSVDQYSAEWSYVVNVGMIFSHVGTHEIGCTSISSCDKKLTNFDDVSLNEVVPSC